MYLSKNCSFIGSTQIVITRCQSWAFCNFPKKKLQPQPYLKTPGKSKNKLLIKKIEIIGTFVWEYLKLCSIIKSTSLCQQKY